MATYMRLYLDASVLQMGRENVMRVWSGAPGMQMEEYAISFEYIPATYDEPDDVWLRAVLEAALKAL